MSYASFALHSLDLSYSRSFFRRLLAIPWWLFHVQALPVSTTLFIYSVLCLLSVNSQSLIEKIDTIGLGAKLTNTREKTSSFVGDAPLFIS
jgi:hypothetical protein